MLKDWQQSIALRLSLAFALLATFVFAALGLYFSRAADAHMLELDAHDLRGKLALIAHVGAQEKTTDAFAARLGDALIGEQGVIVTVDQENEPIFRWPTPELAGPLATANVALGKTPIRLALGAAEYRIIAAEMDMLWGSSARVVVARDIRHHTEFLDQLLQDFNLAIWAAALLTAIVGAMLVRRGLQPVRAIAQTAGRISAGQLAERIQKRDVPPELAELVNAFNAMLGRLEESFNRLSDFSADLAHELRTPIHSLRMQTEVLLGKERDVEQYRDLLASNLEAYERLSRIIADMLFLAKAEHGLVIPHRETVPLKQLCERLIEYYGLLAENLELVLVADEVRVQGDALMLERALGNVLVNAIHHTPERGRVSINVCEKSGEVLITITNSGPLIPPEAMGQIFDRYVRLDGRREGSGLGLAITHSIVLAHKGKISVRTVEQKTEFAISLPLFVFQE
jgi:two-component system heavy metal sensor histidine kinase CusS